MSYLRTCFLLFTVVFLTFGSLRSQTPVPDIRSTVDMSLRPFYHGVASGDPDSTSVMIWTRVTPDTGMAGDIPVKWIVATDPFCANVVSWGFTEARESRDFTVKLRVCDLQPETHYYYVFEAMGLNSITGRTKTCPKATTANPSDLRFAVASCSNYEDGYFNGYNSITKRNDLDAVIHLGDYIYEYATGGFSSNVPGRTQLPSNEIISLDDYRTRYSHYKLDKDLRLAHQLFPFITTWDDHESANNSWATGADNHSPGSEGLWSDRVRNSVRAYDEWMSMRRMPAKDTAEIYRNLRYGSLADLIVLETRVVARDEQDLGQTNNSNRTMLGNDQFEWFIKRLKDRSTKWKMVCQQVMFAPLTVFGIALNSDAWDGYNYERTRILDSIDQNAIDNVVILTGDIHTSWAGNIEGRGGKNLAAEYVVTSITSVSSPINIGTNLIKLLNPHMKYVELSKKGYVDMRISPTEVQGDWVYMSTITTPSYSESIGTRYKVLDGAKKLSSTSSSIVAASGPTRPGTMPDPRISFPSLPDLIQRVIFEEDSLWIDINDPLLHCKTYQTSWVPNGSLGTFTALGDSAVLYYAAYNQLGWDTAKLVLTDPLQPNVTDTICFVIKVRPRLFSDTLAIELISGQLDTFCLAADDLPLAISSSSTIKTASNGTLNVLSDSCISYASNAGYYGYEQIVRISCDASIPQRCDTMVFQIGLTPLVTTDSFLLKGTENLDRNWCLSAADINFNLGQTKIVQAPANGSLIIRKDSCFRYTPDPDFYGFDSTIVVLCTKKQPKVCDTFKIWIKVRNKVTTDIVQLTTIENKLLSACLNPIEVSPSGLSSISSPARNGTVSLANDSCFNYTPNKGFVGKDSFWVKICELKPYYNCDSFLVMVTVLEGTEAELVYKNMIVNGSETWCFNFDELFAYPRSVSFLGAGHGSVSVFPSGCISYTPVPGYLGVDTVWFISCQNDPILYCDTIMVVIGIGQNVGIERPAREMVLFGMYPNPATDLLIFQYYLDQAAEVQIAIYDLQGRQLHTDRIPAADRGLQYGRLGLGDLPSGEYIFELRTADLSYRRKLSRIKP